MPIYIVHGEDDSAALAWLNERKDFWIPEEWRPFNFHSYDAKKIPIEELTGVLQSYPMGAEYRVVLLREFGKADAAWKKQLPSLLENLPATTIVVLWFVPGPKDPKKLGLGSEWKEIVKQAQFVKSVSLASEEDASVFSLLDRLGERQTAGALKALRLLLEQGEPPLRVLAALANQIRVLWQIKALQEDGTSPSEIAQRLDIHPFRVTKGLKHTRKFKDSELSKFVDWFCRADFSLKTGKQEPEHLLELLVLRVCQG